MLEKSVIELNAFTGKARRDTQLSDVAFFSTSLDL
jgi:hypothetical protein